MSQRESTRIPWASLAVVATFVSGTLIVPKAFDLLRPPERVPGNRSSAPRRRGAAPASRC